MPAEALRNAETARGTDDPLAIERQARGVAVGGQNHPGQTGGTQRMAQPAFVGDNGSAGGQRTDGAKFVGVVARAGGVGVNEGDGGFECQAQAARQGAGGGVDRQQVRGVGADPGLFKFDGPNSWRSFQDHRRRGLRQKKTAPLRIERPTTPVAIGVRRGQHAQAGEGGLEERVDGRVGGDHDRAAAFAGGHGAGGPVQGVHAAGTGGDGRVGLPGDAECAGDGFSHDSRAAGDLAGEVRVDVAGGGELIGGREPGKDGAFAGAREEGSLRIVQGGIGPVRRGDGAVGDQQGHPDGFVELRVGEGGSDGSARSDEEAFVDDAAVGEGAAGEDGVQCGLAGGIQGGEE